MFHRAGARQSDDRCSTSFRPTSRSKSALVGRRTNHGGKDPSAAIRRPILVKTIFVGRSATPRRRQGDGRPAMLPLGN